METVLVTGAFGYIGNALVQRLLKQNYNVIGIDNNIKLNWLKELNSVSALEVIENATIRTRALRKLGKYTHYTIDIFKDVNRLKELFQKYKFDTIVNLAQMPSAPYSHMDLAHASWTIQNNTIGTLNITHMIKDYCPDAHLIEIESMGTHNHHINTDIPEGKFQFDYNGRTSEPCIFPKQSGSFYHASKVFNTYLIDSASTWWDINSTVIMQGVVYGIWTPEMEESGINSHFAYDSTFGTVINRFIIQSLMNEPLTIYGKGWQKRGYLALNDSIQCLMLLIENPSKGFRIVNQLADIYCINDLCNIINTIVPGVGFKYMDSPRVERTSDFYYNVNTDTLKKLGFKNTRSIDDELKYMYNMVDKNCLNSLYKEKFVNWK